MPPKQDDATDGGFRQIRKVHVIQGCHFDAGFADTIQGIVGGRWFQQFFPRAAAVGRSLAENATTTAELRFTAQSWVVWLFLNCPESSGLECPSHEQIQQFNASVGAGYITWHALPMNFEPELMTFGMVDAAIELTHKLDDDFGLPRKTVMSQRDVPFMSRAIIPALVRNGVDIVSVGVNGGSTPPNLPPAFIWRDEPSGTQVLVLLLQGGYGGLHLTKSSWFTPMMIPGLDQAAVVDWRGDNAGPPPSAADLIEDFQTLQGQFPGADIIPSSFEDFGTVVRSHFGSTARSQNISADKSGSRSRSGYQNGFPGTTIAGAFAGNDAPSLPVITAEIGDTWIYGVPSDPIKVAKMRAAHRARHQCFQPGGLCANLSDGQLAKVFNATAFLMKNSEHTWGLDHKTVLSPVDHALHQNWSNAEYHKIAAGLPPDMDPYQLTQKYQKLASSWSTQRRFGLDYAIDALGPDHPMTSMILAEWAQQLPHVPRQTTAADSRMRDPELRRTVSTPSLEQSLELKKGSHIEVLGQTQFMLGSRWRVQLNSSTGSVCSLVDSVTGTDYAGPGGCESTMGGTLFAPQYLTLDSTDYNLYELLYNYLWVVDFVVGDDFDDQSKRGIERYNATATLVDTTLEGAWLSNSSASISRDASGAGNVSFRLDVQLRLPAASVTLAGGFQSLWLTLEVTETGSSETLSNLQGSQVEQPPKIEVTLQGFNKTATRMPEALFLRMRPGMRNSSSKFATPDITMAQRRSNEKAVRSPDPGNGIATSAARSQETRSSRSQLSWLYGAGWCMEKLSSWMQAFPVPWGGSTRLHGVSDGGLAFVPLLGQSSTIDLPQLASKEKATPSLELKGKDKDKDKDKGKGKGKGKGKDKDKVNESQGDGGRSDNWSRAMSPRAAAGKSSKSKQRELNADILPPDRPSIRAKPGRSAATAVEVEMDALSKHIGSITPPDGDAWLNGTTVARAIQASQDGSAPRGDLCYAALQGRAGSAGKVGAAMALSTGAFQLESPDAAVVAFGTPTTFAVPTNLPPDFSEGASFLLLSNAWGTNYVSISLGSPMPKGGPTETDVKWRFTFVPLDVS